MIRVERYTNESQEALLRRFHREVIKSGVLGEVRGKRWFVSHSQQRRLEQKRAVQRERRRQEAEPAW